jgi:hypothetical protein
LPIKQNISLEYIFIISVTNWSMFLVVLSTATSSMGRYNVITETNWEGSITLQCLTGKDRMWTDATYFCYNKYMELNDTFQLNFVYNR